MNPTYVGGAALMRQARESLAGKWGLAVGTFAVYIAIIAVFSTLKNLGSIASLIMSGPLAVGVSTFSLALSRKKDARLNQLFDGFNEFGRALAAYLLVTLFTFLWMLLFIIPGIVAGLSYSQTFFILAEDKTIGARDAIRKSKKMMRGYKWIYFCLGLRFIGWFLLSVLTLGIGFFWFVPYLQVTMAKFYDEIRTSPDTH